MEKGKIVRKISYTEGTHVSVLEKEFGKKFIKNMTVDKIKNTLSVNQRGIIFAYDKNAKIGHFFNAINEDGVVKFLDGQIGKSADLVYDYYEILLTN
jgi:hypothetical protein